MSRELQPPVSLVKIELPTVIKNELPESEIVEIGIEDIFDSSESEEEIIPDVKDLDIVYHPVCDHSIKSEILESKHCESVETQVLAKAEITPFIQTENITQRNKTEDTSDKNVTKGTGQAVVEIQGSNRYSNVLSNLETDTQLVLKFSKDLNGISTRTRTRKAKHPEKTNFVKCYKTVETASWKKDKEKINIIKAPVILVEAHEYTSLAKDRHVCNHCQYAFSRLDNLKRHIKRMHREVTTVYQCTKQYYIQKHRDTKYIQWFQCNLCELKFNLKSRMTRHMKIHLKYKRMEDMLGLKSYHCGNCHYKTDCHINLKRHKLVHLKPEKIVYFYCYHCSYKCQRKDQLKAHIFRHHFENVNQGKRHNCDKCDYKTDRLEHLKRHNLVHLKSEDMPYFYCYHCSYKGQRKDTLKYHIFSQHFKNVKQGKRHGCNKCNYRTDESSHLRRHNLIHLKPEEIQYFYCYHCKYKAKHKGNLKKHIFIHFKKEQVKFDCYICNFMTPKRESITKHIKKHSKVQNKPEIKEEN